MHHPIILTIHYKKVNLKTDMKSNSRVIVRIKGSIPEERSAVILWVNNSKKTCAIKPDGYHHVIYNLPLGNVLIKNEINKIFGRGSKELTKKQRLAVESMQENR